MSKRLQAVTYIMFATMMMLWGSVFGACVTLVTMAVVLDRPEKDKPEPPTKAMMDQMSFLAAKLEEAGKKIEDLRERFEIVRIGRGK